MNIDAKFFKILANQLQQYIYFGYLESSVFLYKLKNFLS